jgi:hypothetical protein
MVDGLPLNCTVNFLVTNMSRNEGQMSFPETGQWDFPPYIEMDIEVIKINDGSVDEAPELFEGTRDAVNALSIKG